MAEVAPLGDVLIIGGGCYGSFYAGQMENARAKGAVEYRRLVIVDHDPACRVASLPADDQRTLVISEWGSFLDAWLDASARDQDGRPDMIVPSPFMPHLMAEWLQRRATEEFPGRPVRFDPVTEPLGTPYDRLHPDGVRYVSFADWLCPVHCVEPARCPVIRAPRTWEMGDALVEWAASRNAETRTVGPALFTCRHVVYGVGMYPARAAFEGLQALRSLASERGGGDLAIGSVSACHGAVALLHVGAVDLDAVGAS